MKKVKVVIILALLVSCTNLNGIKRNEAYQLNKNHLEKKYNKTIERNKMSFYIKKGMWFFDTKDEDGHYEVQMDRNGKILDSKHIMGY